MINNYDISIKSIYPSLHECLIKDKNTTTTFGVIVHSHSPPTPPWVLHQFTSNFTEFFINIDPIQDVVAPPELPPIPSESVSKS